MKNNTKKKSEEKVNNKIEENINNKIILGVASVVLLILSIFICYNKFNNKKDITPKNDEISDKEETLDINSNFVKEIYNLIKVNESIIDSHDYHDVVGNAEYTSKDMEDEYRVYYGYRQVSEKYLKNTKSCKDFKNIDFGNYTCGSSSNNKKNENIAIVLDEKFLKENVEKIFGKDSYKSVKYFRTQTGNAFFYDNNSKYVSAEIGVGGSGKAPQYKLQSATKKGDKLYLTEEQTYFTGDNFEISNTVKYRLIFKKYESSYIFESIRRMD